MLKIGTIYISIFHYIYARTYRYFAVPEVVSVNHFLKDKIHIFCCKHLKSDFHALICNFNVPALKKCFIKVMRYDYSF